MELAIRHTAHHLFSDTEWLGHFGSLQDLGGRRLRLSLVSTLVWNVANDRFSSQAAPKEVNNSFSATCCLMRRNVPEGLKILSATFIINYQQKFPTITPSFNAVEIL